MNNIFSENRQRQRLHFSPEHGWMNDPNGLIYHGGLYHMFYQYDPDNITPVCMHWGHAVSTDLVHWRECPVALYPDENGTIYSGSMVFDHSNSSGLGNGQTPPLLALFTYNAQTGDSYTQSQGIAYSCDNAEHFKKYAGNPILTHTCKDFRDPMVFFHEPSGRWIMLLVAGRRVLFYTSKDLILWEQSGSFAPDDFPAAESEIFECPCLFSCKDDSGVTRWCLIVSVFTAGGERYGMRYFVGDFDGRVFTPQSSKDEVRMLDCGWDHYAGALFSGLDGRVVMIGWIGCWYYARQTPAIGSLGSMALPRELSLAGTDESAVLVQHFCPEVEQLFLPGKAYREAHSIPLPAGGCRLRLSLQNANQKIHFNGGAHSLIVTVNAQRQMLCIDRSKCITEYLSDYKDRTFTVSYSYTGLIELDIVLDLSSLELLTGDGKGALTVQYYMGEKISSVTFELAAVKVEVYPAR